MEFTLYYRGPLKSNGSLKDKHLIRKCFHSQLMVLWEQIPLNDFKFFLDPNYEYTLIRKIGNFVFVPLVSECIHMIAELDITFLRPESPGDIIKSGDIDNRIKTLFDALKVPKEDELPKETTPDINENPFFSLLEDDNLITKISINTDRLLNQTTDINEVILLIYVKTKLVRVTIDTIGLG